MRMLCAILMPVVLAGCLQFKSQDGLQRKVDRVDVQEQVRVLEISGVRPVFVRKPGFCELSLEADGRFVRQEERTTTYNVSGRRHVLAVGLFPGTWSMPGMDVTFVWVVPISAVVANTFTLGYPTWNALFIEPFRDYHDATVLTGIETWGFVGCRKYLASNVSEKENRLEKRNVDCGTVVLKGYAVVVEGVRYTPDKNAIVKLPNFPRGSDVKVEIIAPPKFGKEVMETGKEMLGLVLDVHCP